MKRRLVSMLLGITLSLSIAGCNNNTAGAVDNVVTQNAQKEESASESTSKLEIEGASYIQLSDAEITVDGDTATTNTEEAVYVANDIVYYEDGKDFTYGEGSAEDAHSKEEAQKHTVVHITKPGTYVVSGKLEAGQIAVDLGEDAKDDPEAVVTLVLNNIDITCTVAPGVIFYNVYECSSSEEENAVKDVDTSAAGANVLIADGTTNTVNGSYVARIYKSVELNEEGTEVIDSKKLHKYDGAFYSKMSMNINGGEAGDGVLNINAENEGLDSELHLTINGGTINIVSGNDGINTNEDNVSVTTVNGGSLFIRVDGSTGEGDGIDSNGWLVINGGIVMTAACSTSMDAGIDSDKGIHINGGSVVAVGNMLDHISDSEQNYVVFTFQDKVKADEKITLKKGEEEIFFTMTNYYTYLIVSDEFVSEGEKYTLWKGEEQLSVVETSGGGMMMPGGFGGFPGGELPEGFEAGEMPEGFEPGQLPEGFEGGELPEGFEAGELPEGFEPGQLPEGFEGGELPEGFEAGEMPEGFEPGQRPEGNRGGNGFPGGELPEGFEAGELPEGFEPGQRPEGGRGGNGFGQTNTEDAVTEFEMKDCGNMFMVVKSQ